MRVIVAGSRDVTDYSLLCWMLDEWQKCKHHRITEVVSGGALGVDRLGELWADANKVPIRRFLPDYKAHSGRVAPIKRNQEMARYGEGLVALWDGQSKGTKNMIEEAKSAGLRILFARPGPRGCELTRFVGRRPLDLNIPWPPL